MRRVYLDTIGLLAVWNTRDPWHAAAEKALARLIADGAEFLTSEYVLLECGNAASRSPFRKTVVELRRHLLADGKLIVPTETDSLLAWEAYFRSEAGQAGIVDHISFVVMRRLGLTEAFTNDQHFRTAGFQPLF